MSSKTTDQNLPNIKITDIHLLNKIDTSVIVHRYLYACININVNNILSVIFTSSYKSKAAKPTALYTASFSRIACRSLGSTG